MIELRWEGGLIVSKAITDIKVKKQDLYISNRRYLGSKQKMLDFINEVVQNNTKNVKVVADIFGGTGVVADLFRSQGKKVIVNDILTSNFISYRTWFGNEKVDEIKIKDLILELNSLNGINGYVSKNFGNKYFSMENANKIDAIREKIETIKNLNKRERAFLLTSLLYAMDKVANTVGHFDAYRKHMDRHNPIYLQTPVFNENKGNELYNEDANHLVKRLKADLVYIDTPYNSRGYENTYHVLENVIEWKKPEVEGIAMKAVNRNEKASKYTKSKAPEVFNDLISHIDARYILVSYNNMAQKGNSRSNAKISNEEIISCLKKRGDVSVFETDFEAFTSGKSKIENHKELLYLCTVKSEVIGSQKPIQSALNYTGAKFKLLPQLKPLFPKKYNSFIDLFAGGASVSVNVAQDGVGKSYLINDIEHHVIEFFEYLSKQNVFDFVDKVEKTIKKYGLSDTATNGYKYYGCDSAKGLGEYNKKKYLQLRADYNSKPSPILFYLLTVYGFNNQIRFNSKGEYNLPVGKRDFNKRMKSKLINFSQALQNEKIHFSSCDFRSVKFRSGDFIYADPPYLITTATYNENGGWTEQDEIDLYEYLDEASRTGVKFALSNVILHKNKANEILKLWANKYNIYELEYHYNNCNYQAKREKNKTIEVLVTNYDEEDMT